MTFGLCFWIHTPRLRRTPIKEGTRGGGASVASGIRTIGLCFWIHTPRLRRSPQKEGTRGGSVSVSCLFDFVRFGFGKS